MKKYFLPLAFALSLTNITFAQSSRATSKDSILIIKLENDWAKAMIKKDEKVFQKLLAIDFFYTENDKMYTRAEILEAVMSPAESVQKAYNEDMQVHVKGNTIIVTGWLITIGKGADGTFNRKYRFTDIWMNQDGNWQLIGAQDFLMQ